MDIPSEPKVPLITEQLPPPSVIRERLGLILREASLLRRLLRLAEQLAQERARRARKQGAEP